MKHIIAFTCDPTLYVISCVMVSMIHFITGLYYYILLMGTGIAILEYLFLHPGFDLSTVFYVDECCGVDQAVFNFR